MLFMRQVVTALLAFFRASRKVAIYYINGALFKLDCYALYTKVIHNPKMQKRHPNIENIYIANPNDSNKDLIHSKLSKHRSNMLL